MGILGGPWRQKGMRGPELKRLNNAMRGKLNGNQRRNMNKLTRMAMADKVANKNELKIMRDELHLSKKAKRTFDLMSQKFTRN